MLLLKRRLEEIRERLINMAELADRMIEQSVKAIIEHKKDYLKDIDSMERELDKMEVENETMIITTIARYQPEAKYLRILLMDLFVNRDLERIGDHAENIKEQAERIIDKPKLKEYIDLPVMTDITIGMVRDAVKSLETLDTELARDVIARDDKVDKLNEQIIRELYTYMVEDPKNIKVGIRLITVSSNLERVADIATNLAEEVIYMKEGKMLRHQEIDKD
ncbi:MAG: phosphate transport system regulatory protein PhoU [Persephonella sp.]|nr:MAG: phosphate transport system regulatory protein PhoU [Persephonella sp.]